jgi:hypothetical protein
MEAHHVQMRNLDRRTVLRVRISVISTKHPGWSAHQVIAKSGSDPLLSLRWVQRILRECRRGVLDGGQASLVYFGEISSRTESAFVTAFLEQKDNAYAQVLLEQTWRNAEILTAKYRSLKSRFIGSLRQYSLGSSSWRFCQRHIGSLAIRCCPFRGSAWADHATNCQF